MEKPDTCRGELLVISSLYDPYCLLTTEACEWEDPLPEKKLKEGHEWKYEAGKKVELLMSIKYQLKQYVTRRAVIVQ